MLELHKHDVSFVCQLVEGIVSWFIHLQPALEPAGVSHQTLSATFGGVVSPSRAVPAQGCCEISPCLRREVHEALVKRVIIKAT